MNAEEAREVAEGYQDREAAMAAERAGYDRTIATIKSFAEQGKFEMYGEISQATIDQLEDEGYTVEATPDQMYPYKVSW